MKKLALLLMLLPMLSVGQLDSLQEPTTAQEVERLVDKYGGQAVDAFSNLIENATPMAQEGFKMVVRLQIAKGIGDLLPLFLGAIFWYLFVKEYKRIDENKRNKNYMPFDSTNASVWLIASFIISIVCTILAIFTTYLGILHLIAPEWYAIKDILNLVS